MQPLNRDYSPAEKRAGCLACIVRAISVAIWFFTFGNPFSFDEGGSREERVALVFLCLLIYTIVVWIPYPTANRYRLFRCWFTALVVSTSIIVLPVATAMVLHAHQLPDPSLLAVLFVVLPLILMITYVIAIYRLHKQQCDARADVFTAETHSLD